MIFTCLHNKKVKYTLTNDNFGAQFNFCSVEYVAFDHEPPPKIHRLKLRIFHWNCRWIDEFYNKSALSHFRCHSSSVQGVKYRISNNTITDCWTWYVNALPSLKSALNIFDSNSSNKIDKPFNPITKFDFLQMNAFFVREKKKSKNSGTIFTSHEIECTYELPYRAVKIKLFADSARIDDFISRHRMLRAANRTREQNIFDCICVSRSIFNVYMHLQLILWIISRSQGIRAHHRVHTSKHSLRQCLHWFRITSIVDNFDCPHTDINRRARSNSLNFWSFRVRNTVCHSMVRTHTHRTRAHIERHTIPVYYA